MTTAATTLLGLALPVTGELSGTWGDTVNNSITNLLDTAVAGTTTLSTDADVTLTTTILASNQARQAILLCSGARTALRTITAPAQSKLYTIINATTGGYSVKLVGVGPTTGVTVVAGESALVAWNGSDFIKISNTAGGGSFTDLTVSGSLTLSGGTANGVAYLNGSKVVTTGSALTFDGTNVSTTGTASATKLIPTGGSATGNGMYLPAANTLAWSTNGAEVLRLNSSGNLGLGVTPSAWGGNYKAIQNGAGSFAAYSNTAQDIYYGAYDSGIGTWKYLVTGYGVNRLALTNGEFIFYTAPSGTAGNAITFTQAMTLDVSGNLGVGTTSPAFRTDVINNSTYQLRVASNTSNYSNGSIYFGASGTSDPYYWGSVGWNQSDITMRITANCGNGTGGIAFYMSNNTSTPTEKARIDSSGNLLVGTTSQINSCKVSIVQNDALALKGTTSANAGDISFVRADNGSQAFRIAANDADWYFADADFSHYAKLSQNMTAWTFGSDRRIKTDIVELDYGLLTVMAIKPKRYKFISSGKIDIGFIAQELRNVVPEAVSGEEIEFSDEDTAQERAKKVLGVGKETLIPILVKAIQEQQALINSLTSRIAALEAK